jgi:hypothetical protein
VKAEYGAVYAVLIITNFKLKQALTACNNGLRASPPVALFSWFIVILIQICPKRIPPLGPSLAFHDESFEDAKYLTFRTTLASSQELSFPDFDLLD